MKFLLILRHAKSSWSDSDLADHDRPLNKRGKRDAPRMGQLLRDEDLLPDLVLASTAKRARSTAEIVAEHSGYDGEIRLIRDLYAASPEAILEILQGLADTYERIMLVGHNPGLEELLEDLIGEFEQLPTGALAQVALPIQRWGDLNEAVVGNLVNLWRPKELA